MSESSFSYKYDQRYEDVTLLDHSRNKKVNSRQNMVLITHSPLKGFKVESHFHDWYEFTYVKSGLQRITLGTNSYLLSSGDFLLIPSGILHDSEALEKCEKVTLLISRLYLQSIVPQNILNNLECNTISIQSTESYYQYLDLISAYLEFTDIFDYDCDSDKYEINDLMLFNSAFYKFLSVLTKNFISKDPVLINSDMRDSDLLISQIISYIHKNYDKNIKLLDVADMFYCSPQYISKIFKKNKGVTFLDVLNDVRMNHAVYELINTNKMISEICFECGYGNFKSFINVFKKRYGMTPKEYRQNNC